MKPAPPVTRYVFAMKRRELGLLPGGLPLPGLQAAVARARDVREAHAGQDEHHRATPGDPGHEVAGATTAEHLLARAAEGAAEPAAAALLKQDDQDEKHANEHVHDAEKRG